MSNGWDRDIAEARQESKEDHAESVAQADRVESSSNERVDELAQEARAEHQVASDRLTAIEGLTVEAERVAREERMRRLSARLAYAILGLACAVALFLVWEDQGDIERQNDRIELLAMRNSELIHRLAYVDAKIQESRRNAVRDDCEAQNGRFRNFVAEYDRQIAKLPPGDRAEAKESREANISILRTFAPPQDCDDLVREQVSLPQPSQDRRSPDLRVP